MVAGLGLRLASGNMTLLLLTRLLSSVCSREVLQEVLDTDLGNEAFPFSTHKVVNAVGHQVRDTDTHTGGWSRHLCR